MPDPTPPERWPADSTLTLQGVHARRGGVAILRGVDLDFPPGSRTVLIGASGSGKSTLLRLLNRLADPTSGRITLGGVPIESLPVNGLRRRIGLVFQSPRPLPGTVAENLDYPAQTGGVTGPSPIEAMAEVGLSATAEELARDASTLSGGERQRLAIGVALRAGPIILALDEPTAALDPANARRVADALRLRSSRDGLTTIAVTHSREHAAWLGDRAVILEAGRVVDRGPTAEVLARVDAALWAEAGR